MEITFGNEGGQLCHVSLTCWGDGLIPSSGQQALLYLCLCESSQGSRARLVVPISLQGKGGWP